MEDRVVTESNQIAKMLREVVEIMEDIYKTYFNDISAFGKDYTDFGLPPVIVIFDEFSAFLHSVDKKLSKEVFDYIFTIVMKGRQAGVQVEILMQRPSADDLPTNIRAQMGFKAGLGAMDKIGYNVIFDTNNIEIGELSFDINQFKVPIAMVVPKEGINIKTEKSKNLNGELVETGKYSLIFKVYDMNFIKLVLQNGSTEIG